MPFKKEIKTIFSDLYRATAAIIIVFTVLTAASLFWDSYHEHLEAVGLAQKEAMATFNKDRAFRLWATEHGGVYVPETRETPPSPFLSHMPERDIVTPSGRRLTLINPAYIMRQAMGTYFGLYGTQGHITSLNPLNPVNAPDEWEAVALESFTHGIKQAIEVVDLNGAPHLRLMQPMITREGCLKCHEAQGYKTGDVRGGVGVAVPLAPYLAIEKKSIIVVALSHLFIWMLGMAGIGFGFYRGKKIITQRADAEASVRRSRLVLAEAQSIAHFGSWELDLTKNELTWSDEIYLIFGLKPQEFKATYEAFLDAVHPDDRESVDHAFAQSIQNGTPYDIIHRIVKKRTGEIRYVHEKCVHTRDSADKIVRSLGTVHDITETKLAQDALAERIMLAELAAEMGSALTVSGDLPDILRKCAQAIVRHLDAAFARIWIFNIEENILELKASAGIYTRIDGAYSRILPGQFKIGMIAQERKPHITNAVIGDPLIQDQEWAKQEGLVSFAGHPLLLGGRLVGVMAMFSRKPLPQIALKALASVADELAIGIEHKKTEANIQRHMKNLSALRLIDMAINGSLDLRVTLNVLLQQTIDRLEIDAACVLLFKPHSRTLEYAAGLGFNTERITLSRVRLGEGYAGRAALERRSFIFPEIAALAGEASPTGLIESENFKAYAGVPLIAKGQIRGVLEIFHRLPIHPDPGWIEFAEALAGQAAIAVDNAELFEHLQRSHTELLMAYETTIEGWSRALDYRDKETEGHSRRVTEMTVALAQAFGISDEDLVHIRRGALLHDIGKLGVPDNILLKPSKLTDAEMALMKQHPQIAFNLLYPIVFLRPAIDIPYCHHEKWDGTGYPRGLKGDEISMAARIFALVDVWDALCSDQPYRQAWPREKVREHIRSGSGTHFDPNVVDLFLKMEGKAFT